MPPFDPQLKMQACHCNTLQHTLQQHVLLHALPHSLQHQQLLLQMQVHQGGCSVLQRVAACCSVLHTALMLQMYFRDCHHMCQDCCSVLQCVALRLLQCVALRLLQCIALKYRPILQDYCSMVQCVAVCCSVAQRVAVCCRCISEIATPYPKIVMEVEYMHIFMYM